jgi:hypothetical protein
MDEAEQKKQVGTLVKNYINSHYRSRQDFADKVGYSIASINQLVTGVFSWKAIQQIERHTGEKFSPDRQRVLVASPELGGYEEADVQDFCGEYWFIRPNRNHIENEIEVSLFAIEWEASVPGLIISHIDKGSETKTRLGHISMPKSSSHVFISSNDLGWSRLLILSYPDSMKTMKGGLFTVSPVLGGSYAPVIVPVMLCDNASRDYECRSYCPDDSLYLSLKKDLSEVMSRKFLILHPSVGQ